MQLHIYQTTDEVITSLADHFIRTVNTAIETSGECSVVLSGGSSPEKLYKLLASENYINKADWNKVCFFFGDERYIPFTDADNNGRMVKQAMLDPLGIDESRIFYIDTTLSPEKSAKNYQDRIIAYFKQKPIRFDITLLGLGDNSHTASLFPYTKVLNENKALVSAVYLEDQQTHRITMTAPLINESHAISFLVYGEKKADAVYNVLEGETNTDRYPAQLIESEWGRIDWFMDEPASRRLQRKIKRA